MKADTDSKHYTIVTVDIEGFGSATRTDPIRARLRVDLAEALDAAVERLHRRNPIPLRGDTGDGWFLLFASHVPKPAVLDTFVPAVESRLNLHNRAANSASRMRLRIGIHHGDLILQDGRPVGEALNYAFRIIDNDVLRRLLRGSDQSHTVVAISDDYFEKIIRQMHGGLNPDDFYPVLVDVKEVQATVWIRGQRAPESSEVAPISSTLSPAAYTSALAARVITLNDLAPTSLYLPLTDIHNSRLYARGHPELPLAQHLETALLLGDRAVLHCADAYRSREVAQLIAEFEPLVASGDLLFLLGENASRPRDHFRGYIDLKVKQYGLSDRGARDVTSLKSVDPDAAERTESLLDLSPYALIRGFNGSDGFVRAAREDLHMREPIVLRDPYHASAISRLRLSLRQLLDLCELSPDGKLSRALADEQTTRRLYAEIERLASHPSFSRQILMNAISEHVGMDEHHPMYSVLEERVSLLHLRGTTGALHHLEVTSHSDVASPYYYKALLEHLSVLADTPNRPRFGPDLLMRLRAQAAWPYFAAYHLSLMATSLHHRMDADPGTDSQSKFHWSRRLPEFDTIRLILREYWE